MLIIRAASIDTTEGIIMYTDRNNNVLIIVRFLLMLSVENVIN